MHHFFLRSTNSRRQETAFYFEGFNVKKIYDYQIGQYDSLTGGESKSLRMS